MRLLKFLTISSVALGAMASYATGQSNPYYDTLSEPAASEIQWWYAFYLDRIDNGAPNPQAFDFAFTDARMNSPFFSPLSAAVRTAAKAIGNSSQTCVTETEISVHDTTGSELGQNVRSFMLEGMISTNDAESSQAHAIAINTALIEGEDVVADWSGTTLWSSGLPVTDAQTGEASGGELASASVAGLGPGDEDRQAPVGSEPDVDTVGRDVVGTAVADPFQIRIDGGLEPGHIRVRTDEQSATGGRLRLAARDARGRGCQRGDPFRVAAGAGRRHERSGCRSVQSRLDPRPVFAAGESQRRLYRRNPDHHHR